MLRHAVLGAGGVGGLLAGALARAGADVVLLLRPESLARYRGRLSVESAVLGDFAADVPAAATLDRAVDVLWVATKATQLEAALAAAQPDAVGDAVVVPLLNGVDHVARLRDRYRRVAAGTIRVESERAAPGLVRQPSPFLNVEIAGADEVVEDVRRAGIDCRADPDEVSMLWRKLVFLAPAALATSAAAAPLGAVREDGLFTGCRGEALSVARAEGAVVDGDAVAALHAAAPASMRSSMQRDVEAGREPELDAIAGPILRGGARRGLPTDATTTLVERIRARIAA